MLRSTLAFTTCPSPQAPAIWSVAWRTVKCQRESFTTGQFTFNTFNSERNPVPRLFSSPILINSGEITGSELQMWPRSGDSHIIRIRIIPFFTKMTHFRWLLWLCQPFISPAIQMKMQLYGEPMKCQLNGWLTCTDILNCSYALLYLPTFLPSHLSGYHLVWLHNRTHFISPILPHVPTPVHPTLHLTFFQTNTCKFSLTENTKTKLLQLFLQLNKKVPKRVTSPQRKEAFPLY